MIIIFLLNAFTNNKHVQEKCLNKQPGNLSKLKITQKSSVYHVQTRKTRYIKISLYIVAFGWKLQNYSIYWISYAIESDFNDLEVKSVWFLASNHMTVLSTVSLRSCEYSKNNESFNDKIHYITMILYLNYKKNKKTVL